VFDLLHLVALKAATVPFLMGRTQANILPGTGQLPKSPLAQGGLDDAKFVELADTLTPGARKQYDVNAMGFYVDLMSNTLGDLVFSIDDCFPDVRIKVGFFFRLRPFTRLIIANPTSGVNQPFHLIYSINPDFLVMQFAP